MSKLQVEQEPKKNKKVITKIFYLSYNLRNKLKN